MTILNGILQFYHFINYLSSINEKMVLPEFLSGIEEWMKSKELQASF